MRIIIHKTVKEPIYEQIKEQVKAAILSGELQEGEMLPSIRQLARDLKISVITTSRAYTDLEQEGFITLQQGKGGFVLPMNSEMIREQLLRKIEESFLAAVNTAKIAQISQEELMRMFEFTLEEQWV